MTAILGAFGLTNLMPDAAAIRRALSAAPGRGAGTARIHSESGAILGVARPGLSAGSASRDVPDFTIEDDYVVAADASLYYVDDLRRALGARVPARASASQLVLAAYRAFGAQCVEKLEGDYAFVIWHRHSRRALCARDFTGRRPLYLTEWRGGFVVASSLESIAALPGFDAEVDVAAVGADAAGLIFSLDDETCLRGVRTLRAGWTASWTPREGVRTERAWRPDLAQDRRLTFDQAAEGLLALLVDAAGERLAGTKPTAVWMSGGRDSTAVFAAAMKARGARPGAGPVVPISRSHPPGDTGREDEAIEEIARLWNVSPNWVDAQSVPMFTDARRGALSRAEPFAQPFQGLTSALATAAHAAGACVALDGYGGDFLFQISPIYLGDLVARGRVAAALRDWRVIDGGLQGLRGFVQWGVQPNLPRWACRAVGVARRRPLRGYMERVAPPWIDPRFLRDHAFRERTAALSPAAQPGRSSAERETRFYMTHQFFARVNAAISGLALARGVELRSPLLDRRVVQFALSRPREERNTRGDAKQLLRAAMRGLLPESVLASRRQKTGTLATYFSHHMRNDGLALLTQALPAPALSAVGVVMPKQFEEAVARFRAEGAAYPHTESLFCTLQAELWLSGRADVAAAAVNGRRSMVG